MSNSNTFKEVINLEVASKRYGFPLSTLRRLVSQKRVPHIKLGKSVRIDVEVFEKWIDEHKIDAQNPL